MPSRTYMVVHERRDHRIAVPRPDLSAALGTPNACARATRMRGAAWAADGDPQSRDGRRQAVRRRGAGPGADAGARRRAATPRRRSARCWPTLRSRGSPRPPRWHRGRRAEALALAGRSCAPPIRGSRLGAVQALAGAPLTARVSPSRRWPADPARAVRLAAAPLLAGADRTAMGPDERRDVDAVFAEHRAWLAANGDRAEAVVAQAGLHRADGDGAAAQAAFERALRLDDTSIVAYLNFADHLRGAGDDAAAEALLRKACALYPESADAHHALGLALVRRKQAEQGVRQLARAAELAPGNSHYAYAYGVGLYSTRQHRPRAGHAEGRTDAVPREPADPGDAAGAVRR